MSLERTERKEIAKWAPSEPNNPEKMTFVTANREINFPAIDAGVKAAIESSHLPTLQECRDGLLLVRRFEEIRDGAIQTKNRIFRYINLIDDELFKIKKQLITRGGSSKSHESTLNELGLSKRRSQVLDLKHSIPAEAREAYIDECDRACIAATDAGLLKLVRIEKPAAPPLPDGKYGLFNIDLPWEHTCDHNAWFVSPKRHYPVMSEREIVAMAPEIDLLAAKDCVLFLWVPACLLDVALRVIEAWKFRYCTNWVWCKVDREESLAMTGGQTTSFFSSRVAERRRQAWIRRLRLRFRPSRHFPVVGWITARSPTSTTS